MPKSYLRKKLYYYESWLRDLNRAGVIDYVIKEMVEGNIKIYKGLLTEA